MESGRPAVVARGLVKRYGAFTAVDGISFTVGQRECFGLLGPNGAGKTTTLRLLSGVSPLTAGELWVAGLDIQKEPRQVKALLGVVSQEDNLDPDLNVLQNLLSYARFFDLPRAVARARAEEALRLFQLEERAQARISELSRGMRRRLLLARAWLNQPQIMVLDEPTTGLDPQARHLVWQKLRQLQAQGLTVILSTHYMEEAAYLCDRLAVMDRGRILVEGSPQELVAQHGGDMVVELHLEPGCQEDAAQRLAGLGLAIEATEDVLFVFGRPPAGWQEVLDSPPVNVVERRATLEDVFLRLTGRALRD